MFKKACPFLLQMREQALDSTSVSKYHQHNRHQKCRVHVFRKYNRKMSNNKWRPNGLCSESGMEINTVWSRMIMNFEMWIMYVSWNLPSSPVLSLSRFSSNVKTISAAETEISTASTARSWRKIALILLLRHFWTLNFSSLKQRKGNNIYKLTQTWNSECSSYKYSMWQRTNVRTLRVCLQQRSSKVTWNYTWNLTLRRWIVYWKTSFVRRLSKEKQMLKLIVRGVFKERQMFKFVRRILKEKQMLKFCQKSVKGEANAHKDKRNQNN